MAKRGGTHAQAKGKAEQIERLAEGLEAHEKEGIKEHKRGKKRSSGRKGRR